MGSYRVTFGDLGYNARYNAIWWPLRYEKNCYAHERWEVGCVRWCKGNAMLQIPLPHDKPIPDRLNVSFVLHHPDVESRPVIIRYGNKNGTIYRIVMNDHSWRHVSIPITDDYIFTYKGGDGIWKKDFVLSIDVSRTWIPKEWGVNEDTRELGVAILVGDSC